VGVYDVTWSLSGVDSIRWGLQSVSMWRPPVTARRTSLEVPGRHGAISAGLPVFEEPTVSLTMWLHGSTQDDIEDAALELVGLLTAPGLTLSRTSGNLVTSAPAVLVSVTPDEFTTAREATFEVVLAIPSALLRADVVDSTLTVPGAVPGLTGSTGPVGDAILRVQDPDDFELTDVVSGTGVSWSGALPGWLLFIDTAALRAWLSQDPNAWAAGSSGSVVRTNLHPDPRATAVGSLWGYQLGSGETAATTTVTPSTPKRTNRIRNPRSVASGTQWTQGGGTAGANYTADNITGWDQNVVPGVTTARRLTLTNAANVTSLYFRPTPTAATDGVPVTPGMFAGCKAVVQTSRSLSFRTFLQFYDAAGTFVASSAPTIVTTAANVAQEVSTVGVVPAGAAFMIPYIGQPNTAPGQANGDTWLCSAVIDAQASTEAGALAMLAEPYFDGDTPNTGGATYAWTVAANASPSTAAFNDGPVLPDGTQLGTYVRRTVTAAKTGGSSGPWCRTPVGGVPMSAGQVVAPTMHVRFSVPVTSTTQSTVRNGSAGAGVTTETVTFPADTWLRVGRPVTATGPGDNTQVWATLAAGMILPVGATVDETGGQVERGDAVLPYFDGDSPDSALVTNAWTGPANASPSVQTVQTGKATSLLDFPPAGRLQLWPRMPGTNPAERTARVAFTGASEVVVRARPAYL